MTDLREQEMQNRIDALSTTAENLKTENQMLKAQVAHLQKMVYGSRTETTKRLFGDTDAEEINLFNEAEIEAKKNAPEPCIEVPAHQRRKKQKNHLAEILASAPHEERVITLPEDQRICKRCGAPLVSMGKEKFARKSNSFRHKSKSSTLSVSPFSASNAASRDTFPSKSLPCRNRSLQNPLLRHRA